MLSYRHGFHAGHHADVLKHALLVYAAQYLQRKPAGILILDTHAGAGEYDLQAPEALKLRAFEQGIAPVLAAPGPAPELLAPYLEMVRAANPDGGLRHYPGSAALASRLRRPQDRVTMFELHTTDYARLAESMRRQQRVSVQRIDGMQALIAAMPPAERRGLFLIDPSYEIKTDYDTIPRALGEAWKRFPSGVFMLWYPVIDRARTDALLAALKEPGLHPVYRVEFCHAADGAHRGMTGSGMAIVNPPYTLPGATEAALPWLAETLRATGPVRAEWLP